MLLAIFAIYFALLGLVAWEDVRQNNDEFRFNA